MRYLVPTNPEHTNTRTNETLEHRILELQKSLEHKNPSNFFLGPLAGWLVGWLAGGVRGGMPWVGVVGHCKHDFRARGRDRGVVVPPSSRGGGHLFNKNISEWSIYIYYHSGPTRLIKPLEALYNWIIIIIKSIIIILASQGLYLSFWPLKSLHFRQGLQGFSTWRNAMCVLSINLMLFWSFWEPFCDLGSKITKIRQVL